MFSILIIILFLLIGVLVVFLIPDRQKNRIKGPVKPSDLPPSPPCRRTAVEPQPFTDPDPWQSHVVKDVIFDPNFHLGFVAADADGSLFIFDRMPVRDLERMAWYPRPDNNPSDRGCFEANFLRPTVTLTWDDEPRLCYFSIFKTNNPDNQ